MADYSIAATISVVPTLLKPREYERDPAEGLSAAPKTDMPVVEVLGEARR